MATCTSCGSAIENTAQTGVMCQTCFDEQMDAPAPSSAIAVAGFALAISLVPFVIYYRVTNTSRSTVNGLVTAASYSSTDYVAVSLGPVAMVIGLVALAAARKNRGATRKRDIGIAIAAIVIGALQIVRGLMPP